MAVGKNKRVGKGGKKGSKKKIVDTFAKKEWYDVKAPALFNNRNIGKTCVNKTVGKKVAADSLMGRCFDVSLADLQNDEVAYRKFRLIAENVQGREVLTNFHGMSLTTDKLKSMVKKWQTLISAIVDAKTTDGYLIRMFCIGFTKKTPESMRKTCYAQANAVRRLRRVMVSIMNREISNATMRQLVNKLIPDSISKDIEHDTFRIYPLHDVFIRKVKIVKKPKFELSKLMDMHTGGQVQQDTKKESKKDASDGEEDSEVIARPVGYVPVESETA